MEAKIFVIEFPSIGTILNEMTSIFDDVFQPNKIECERTRCCGSHEREIPEDLTPPKFKVRNEFGSTPIPEWGIGGKPADENLRFGYQGPCVDEPRCEDYDDREEFEFHHALFDEYVSAAEDCIEYGLEKKSDAPIHRCEAIRKPIDCPPPMRDEIPNGELIGETHWFDEELDWPF